MKNATPPPPRCAKCGAELTADSAGEWCPACIVRWLAEEDRHDDAGSAATVLLPPTPPAGRSRPDGLEGLPPQYEIESLIGRGGMGAVYRGRHLGLNRPVAIKVLPADMLGDPEFAVRFRREARTLAKLHHPGIVSVHDSGETADGNLYFTMELVEGTDLAHLIRGKALPPAAALEIASQVCDALQYAHDQGVIHRDIKPANVLVTRDGRAKLADFGLARPDEDIHSRVTKTQRVMGTADYMAPEHRAGLPDHRADIFSLGVMLYEMLTGHTPRGNWPAPSKITSVDHRLDQIVLKALELEPDHRYQRASDLKSDLEMLKTAPQARKLAGPGTRGRQAAAGIAAGVVAGLLLAISVPLARHWQGMSGPPAPAGLPRVVEVTRVSEFERVQSLTGYQVGFASTGVLVAGPEPELVVEVDPADAGALRISRLVRSMESGADLWVPYQGAPPCEVKLLPARGRPLQAGLGAPSPPKKPEWLHIVPAKPLRDGAYCVHEGRLTPGRAAWEYCGLFVVNGIPAPSILDIWATAESGSLTLAMKIANTGSGAFEDGMVELDLYRESLSGADPQKLEAKHHPVARIGPQEQTLMTVRVPTQVWPQGTYSFQCRIGLRPATGAALEGASIRYSSKPVQVNWADAEFDVVQRPAPRAKSKH